MTEGPRDTVLLEVYRAQWADIHHTRQQDWELSKVVLVGSIGVSGLRVVGEHEILELVVAVLFLIISVMAIAVTIRHKNLFREKMSVVMKLEKRLRVSGFMVSPTWGQLGLFSTQNVIIVMYSAFAMFFAAFLFIDLL